MAYLFSMKLQKRRVPMHSELRELCCVAWIPYVTLGSSSFHYRVFETYLRVAILGAKGRYLPSAEMINLATVAIEYRRLEKVGRSREDNLVASMHRPKSQLAKSNG